MWWNQRRPEIVELFDREIYGRVPKDTPKVRLGSHQPPSTPQTAMSRITTKTLVGHVDNSSYPLITVDIQLELTTPDNATGPVPVIMEFGFIGPFPRSSRRDPGATSPTARPNLAAAGPRQRLGLRRSSVPGSIQADNGPASPKASSASATKASLASSTTGAPSAPGPGEQAALSTTSKPTSP